MKAVICTRYGPPEVLQLAETPKPSPKDNEILIKIHATTVAAGDVRIRRFDVPPLEWIPARLFLGIFRPKRNILGMEVAGEVEETGKDVKSLKPKDKVFAFAGFGFGAYAEYICLPENGKPPMEGLVAKMPSNLSCEEAAAIPIGGLAALNLLRKGNVEPGMKVMVYGASGSVGTYAVQLAAHFGASVTAVCGPWNLELVKSLGASRAMDYTTGELEDDQERYGLVFDAVGKLSGSAFKRALLPGGKFVSVEMDRKDSVEDLAHLSQLAEMGEIKPVIDKTYALDQIAEAHEYVQKGHKKGNVVIRVSE